MGRCIGQRAVFGFVERRDRLALQCAAQREELAIAPRGAQAVIEVLLDDLAEAAEAAAGVVVERLLVAEAHQAAREIRARGLDEGVDHGHRRAEVEVLLVGRRVGRVAGRNAVERHLAARPARGARQRGVNPLRLRERPRPLGARDTAQCGGTPEHVRLQRGLIGRCARDWTQAFGQEQPGGSCRACFPVRKVLGAPEAVRVR